MPRLKLLTNGHIQVLRIKFHPERDEREVGWEFPCMHVLLEYWRQVVQKS